jgi:hypothetical protein
VNGLFYTSGQHRSAHLGEDFSPRLSPFKSEG